jgi:hypothetical protein
MRRKVNSTSAHAHRELVRSLGKTLRSVKTADRRRPATTPRGGADPSLDRGGTAGPSIKASTPDPEVTDDLPEFAAVLDRELDAIEVYLGASLDEMLRRPD